jgi:prephenate dehydrogenase
VASVIVRDGQRGRALADLIEQWGARVVNVTADQHDRVAAAAQALTHAAVIAFGAALTELDVDIADLDRMGLRPPRCCHCWRASRQVHRRYAGTSSGQPLRPAARRALVPRGVAVADYRRDGTPQRSAICSTVSAGSSAPTGRLSRTQRARAAGHDTPVSQ